MKASEIINEALTPAHLVEKWSQKYKRSIDCSHPKGFSQRAHCAGKKKEESIDETRNAAFAWIKSKLPKWPDYVLRDWIYNAAKGNFGPDTIYRRGAKPSQPNSPEVQLRQVLAGEGMDADTQWQLVPNFKFSLDIFNPWTVERIKARWGGESDMGMGIYRDAERHATQAALAKQQGGIRKEPVILKKVGNQYELIEGWHRTIQHFKQFPDGYVGPAWVATNARPVSEALTPADPVEKWIATFKKSTHPKFAGKTPEQREKQARMAHYRAVQNKKTVKEGVAEADGPDIQGMLADVRDEMEGINDASMRYGQNVPPGLTRDYRALTAIESVIKNHIKASKNNLLDNNIFMYDYDGDPGEIAAIHVELKGTVADVKWLGSYNAQGGQLYRRAMEEAKRRGATSVHVEAKWNSEGFYRKMGLDQGETSKTSPFTDSPLTKFTGKLKEADGPDMSRRGFLGGLGALVASSGLPKLQANTLTQLIQTVGADFVENLSHSVTHRRGGLTMFDEREIGLIHNIADMNSDMWAEQNQGKLASAYKKLTGEYPKFYKAIQIIKDAGLEPREFLSSEPVLKLAQAIRADYQARWAASQASADPFKDPDYTPGDMKKAEIEKSKDSKTRRLEKKRDRAYKELTAKKDDKRMKGTAVGRMGPIQAPLKPTHISPSGVATNMSPDDDDYQINYGVKKPTGRFVKPLTGKAK